MKGYAVPSARAPIDKVEVSMNRGKTWYEACVTYCEGRWAWVLWEASVDAVNEEEAFAAMNARSQGVRDGECVEGGKRVAWCRAWDTNGNVQTKMGTTPWNLRGVAYNGYGRFTW